ncbi:hypothetical protein EJC49_24670 [Aquibium carbonis]|uniref:PRC-barrel domain-containing protein n=1 Tax=Aquibium carbonis TaxID=2495581 RepID=A0A429YFL4_9HYPH|nr:PRC-barrel domain-containing protein [Aquibium carbonis]RST80201.1 hypothetical protein EJC49_24670 [Aquibium carbonis]
MATAKAADARASGSGHDPAARWPNKLMPNWNGCGIEQFAKRAACRSKLDPQPVSATPDRSVSALSHPRRTLERKDDEMKTPTKLFLAAGLMCGTAAPAALAQDANQNASVQACERLTTIVQNYEDRFRAQWIDRANEVIASDGRTECAQYVAQAEQAIDELERRDQQAQQQTPDGQAQAGTDQAAQTQDRTTDTDGGRIVVSQPEPRILVEQDAPEITYSQDPAQARVAQGTPEIIVRQGEPTVRVQIPRPQITIDQPEPEIIVRMPEPDVSVDVPEPEFNVSQAQPQVRVNQPEPEVQVQMEQPEVDVQDQAQAQVQVERDQAVVRREGGEQQAQVQVERAEPQVSYERAEPNVEYEMDGEPRVTFNRTGEPTVRVERMGDQAQDQQAEQGQQFHRATQAQQGAPDGEHTASIQPDGMSEQAYEALRGDGQMEGTASAIPVGELVGRDVANTLGQEIGQVERVVANGNRVYLILSDGAALDIIEHEVALPIDRMILVGDDEQLILQGLNDQDLQAMPQWNSGDAQDLDAADQVEILRV